MPRILAQTADIVVAKAGAVRGHVPVYGHFVPVKTVKTVPGPDPDKAPAILENALYRAVGQPLFIADMAKG
jgi:hypothetical protein